jgi:Caudovirales tail fibre assembly protein.
MGEVQYYYSIVTKGFYGSDYPKVITDNGLTMDDLVPITTEQYLSYINPPEGKYLVFDDTGPHLEDLPPVDYVAIAENERNRLLAIASSKIVPYQTKLLLGRELTDDEKAILDSWLNYSDAVSATDTSNAPDVDWPVPPSA